MNYYRIKSISHTGVDGERYSPRTDGRYPSRVNRIVELDENDLKVGLPFDLLYVKDEYGNDYRAYKRTSYVVDWDYCYVDRIRIETYKSIYELEKVEVI